MQGTVNQSGNAVGTASYALFALTGTSLQQTNKYSYASNGVTSGTKLTLTTYDRAVAVGNAVEGIFCQGTSSLNTDKYVHSGDTTANGTSLLAGTTRCNGWNNDVSGIIPSGGNNTTSWNKWTFANDTVTSFPSSSTGVAGPLVYGVANGIPGISVV